MDRLASPPLLSLFFSVFFLSSLFSLDSKTLEARCTDRVGKSLSGNDCLKYESLPLDGVDVCKGGDEVVPRRFFAIGGKETPHTFDLHSATNPTFRFEYFDDESALSYLRDRFGKEGAGGGNVTSAFSCLLPPAYRADLFRYASLLKEGGVYVDADQVLLLPLERVVPLCKNATVGHDIPQNVGKVRSASKQMKILSGVAGHPVWRCMVDGIVSNVMDWKRPTHSLLFSGPVLLERCIQETRSNVSVVYRDASSGKWPDGGGMVGKEGLLSIELGSGRDFHPVREDNHYSVLMQKGKVVRPDCPLLKKRTSRRR